MAKKKFKKRRLFILIIIILIGVLMYDICFFDGKFSNRVGRTFDTAFGNLFLKKMK